MSILKKLLMIMVVAVMFSSNTLIANATSLEGVNPEKDKIESANEFALELKDLDENDQDKVKNKVKKLISSEKIKIQSDMDINYENISIGENLENNDIIINAPLKDKEHEVEYITIVLADNELNSYQENHFKADSENHTVDSSIWENGKESYSEIIQLDKESFEKQGEISTFGFWSKFNDCLASMGIAAWAITAASIACTGLGPGAIPCYYGLSFLTGGVIGHCYDKAK